jgi:hypothetical protein
MRQLGESQIAGSGVVLSGPQTRSASVAMNILRSDIRCARSARYAYPRGGADRQFGVWRASRTTTVRLRCEPISVEPLGDRAAAHFRVQLRLARDSGALHDNLTAQVSCDDQRRPIGHRCRHVRADSSDPRTHHTQHDLDDRIACLSWRMAGNSHTQRRGLVGFPLARRGLHTVQRLEAGIPSVS